MNSVINKIIFALVIITLTFCTTIYFLKDNFSNNENLDNPSNPPKAKVNLNLPKSLPISKITYEPLTNEQKEKIMRVILSNEMVKKIPEKSPISLQFFHFNYGYRTWQDIFIMADGKLLENANPVISLSLSSKYISEFKENNFCEIIQKAKENGDLGFDSEYSEVKLLWKYKGLIKYKDCFGI